jgi:hypothetical protein
MARIARGVAPGISNPLPGGERHSSAPRTESRNSAMSGAGGPRGTSHSPWRLKGNSIGRCDGESRGPGPQSFKDK